MATRLYLPSGGTSPATRATSAYWLQEDIASWFPMGKVKTSTAQSYDYGTVGLTAAYTPRSTVQFCSERWNAYNFTAADEIKLQVRASSNASADQNYLTLSLRVVSADASVVRGILFEGSGPTKMDGGYAFRNASLGAAGAHVHVQNSVAMQAGDRLLAEIGYAYSDGNSTCMMYLGDNEAADLPEDETTTGAYNPWVELSATLVAYNPAAAATNIMLNII